MDLKRKQKAIISKWLIALVVLSSISMAKTSYANNQDELPSTPIEATCKLPTGGTITMLETILRINTFNEPDKIQEIRLIHVSSGLSVNLAGCKNSICEYTIPNLPKGVYKVRVKTSQSFINETIVVK